MPLTTEERLSILEDQIKDLKHGLHNHDHGNNKVNVHDAPITEEEPEEEPKQEETK